MFGFAGGGAAHRRPRLGRQEVVRRVVAAWMRLADTYPRSFPLIYRDRAPVAIELQPAELIIGAMSAAGFTAPRAARAYRSVISFVDGVLLSRTISGYDPQTDMWHRVTADLTEHLPAVHAARRTLVDLTDAKVIAHGLNALLIGIDEERGRTPRANGLSR